MKKILVAFSVVFCFVLLGMGSFVLAGCDATQKAEIGGGISGLPNQNSGQISENDDINNQNDAVEGNVIWEMRVSTSPSPTGYYVQTIQQNKDLTLPAAPQATYGATFNYWRVVAYDDEEGFSENVGNYAHGAKIPWKTVNQYLTGYGGNYYLEVTAVWSYDTKTIYLHRGTGIQSVDFGSSVSNYYSTSDGVRGDFSVGFGSSYNGCQIIATTIPGYKFLKWTTANAINASEVDYYTNDRRPSYTEGRNWAYVAIDSSSKTMLYAWAEPKTIKLTLNYNNSAGTTKTLYYKYGSPTLYINEGCTSATQLTSSYRPYGFAGYYTAETGGTQIFDANGNIMTSSKTLDFTTEDEVTLYAHNIYTITLNKSGGTGGISGSTSSDTLKFQYKVGFIDDAGTQLQYVATPTRTLYTFDGYWYSGTQVIDTDGNILTNSTFFTTNTTVSARWIGKEFKVNVFLAIDSAKRENVPDTSPGAIGTMQIKNSSGTVKNTYSNVTTTPANCTMNMGDSIVCSGVTPAKNSTATATQLSLSNMYIFGVDSQGKETQITYVSASSGTYTFSSSSYASSLSEDYVELRVYFVFKYNTYTIYIGPGSVFNGNFSRSENLCGKVKATYTTYDNSAGHFNVHENVSVTIDFTKTGNAAYTFENNSNIKNSVLYNGTVSGHDGNFWGIREVLVGTEVKIEAIDVEDYFVSPSRRSSAYFFSFDEQPPEIIKSPESHVTTIAVTLSSNKFLGAWFLNVSSNKLQYDAESGEYYFEDGLYPQEYVTDQAILTRLNAGEGTKSGSFYYNNGQSTVRNDVVTLDEEKYVSFDVSSDTTFMAGGNLVSLHEGDVAWFKYVPVRWIVRFDEGLDGIGTTKQNFTVVSQKVLSIGSVVLNDAATKYGWDSYNSELNSSNYYTRVATDSENFLNYSFQVQDAYSRFVNGSNNVVQEGAGSSGYARVASVAEIEEATDDKRAEASDLVSFLLRSDGGCVDYWTRDLHSLGNGKAVSGAGADIVRDLRTVLGVRFAATMTEGSNMIGF